MSTIYHFPVFKRGDTWKARVVGILTNTDTEAAVAIASARMQVRKSGNKAVIHEWTTEGDTPNLTISGAGGNTLTAGIVEPSVTATWPPGTHVYDLEITLDDADSTVVTVPEGKFPIKADVTRDD